MELANSPAPAGMVRPAVAADARAITRLLQSGAYSHVHSDWRLPAEWLGEPGFLVYTDPAGRLLACLALTADPPPAAWVRLAAVAPAAGPPEVALRPLLTAAETATATQGVTEVAWLASQLWLDPILPALGFRPTHAIDTYYKPDMQLPTLERPAYGLQLRPVRSADFPLLVELEQAAFAPLWRHSLDGLRRGWQEAANFDVAERGGEVAGFQFSVWGGDQTIHVVRLTVAPAHQGQGVGGALLAHALMTHRAQGARSMSLNTQSDNRASQRLYIRFGFQTTGQSFAVWSKAPAAHLP